MKNIEDFIRENKEEFNVDFPSDRVWNNISNKLNTQKSKFSWKPYMAAASIMLFISLTWIIANQKFNGNTAATSNNIPSEIQEAQIQFASLIEIKRNELSQYKSTNPELVRDFEYQLVELQRNYKALLPQLNDANKKDIVLQAVIENLQMQVNVLNQQIEIINQLKNKRNETEEIVPL